MRRVLSLLRCTRASAALLGRPICQATDTRRARPTVVEEGPTPMILDVSGTSHVERSRRASLERQPADHVGYRSEVRSRFRVRWAVALFIAIGLAVALVLLLRDLDDHDVPEETGTSPQHVSARAR
jgi:hypothetical protein